MKAPAWLRLRLTPAADSSAADSIRRGRSPRTDCVHLLWSLWVFITPLISGGYDMRWMALTLLSYPIFLWLYAKTFIAPRREAWRYALGMAAMSLLRCKNLHLVGAAPQGSSETTAPSSTILVRSASCPLG